MKLLNISLSLILLASCTSRADNHTDTVADTVMSQPSDPMAEDALPDTISVAFVGDVMMGTTFPDSIHGSHLPPDDGAHLFDDVKEIIRRVDFAGCNLEGSFLDGPGAPRPMTNPNTYFLFRMPTKYVGNLVDAGFDFAGIANNHINDFGEAGRSSTIKTVKDAGLAVAGLKNRCETAYVESNGVRFGIAQVGHGGNNVNVNNIDEVRRVVTQMRDSADIVILSFHGGAEGSAYTHVPFAPEMYVGEKRGNVVEVAHAAIDAGADAVFGHGPHVVRGAELYKDHIIFYSLGNFCTPYRMGINGINGQAPVAEVLLGKDGKFIGGKIHSFIQQRGQGPKTDPTNTAARQIRELSASDFPSSPLKISSDGTLGLF